MKEYRLCWSASTNISFRGETEWELWEGDEDATDDQIMDDLTRGGAVSDGLEVVLNASGFDWWVETRDQGAPHP